MKKIYKVVALSMSGKHNKIFKSGDEVTQDVLESPAEALVESGFLKEIESKESPKEEAKKEPVKKAPAKKAPAKKASPKKTK